MVSLRIGFVLFFLSSWSGLIEGVGPSTVQLLGWAGEGAMVRGNGQGPDLVQLIAEAEWDRSSSRDASRYLVRVTLPDGQAETRPFPTDTPPGRRRFAVYVPASSVRNLAPKLVKVVAVIVDAGTGAPVSNALGAGIEDFPRPRGDDSANDSGPFGWGKPLEGPVRVLPNSGPDGLSFARIVGQAGSPGFFLATTEASVRQLGQRLKGYDPKAGRSDEFSLEGPEQPAVGLSPSKALEYLRALGQADPSGPSFRLPTSEEWARAARAGKPSAFWWGESPTYPAGANFLGPEPALGVDGSAPSRPPTLPPTFRANPFGLFHTFGNVDEWATLPGGKFARMGGHFRTEPASPLPEVAVGGPEDVGPDPFVGVRPAFDLSPAAAAVLIRKRFAGEPGLAGVAVGYDPDRSTVRLTGKVADPSSRRRADSLLEGLWFVSSVEDQLESPAIGPNQLARLQSPTGPIRKVASLGRSFLDVPITVQWLDPLPVAGSEWWVNVYLPGGQHVAHKLAENDPGRARRLSAVLEGAQPSSLGVAGGPAATVALSLGGPSPDPAGPRVVSNPAVVRTSARPGSS